MGRKGDETRRRIREKALPLFAERGFRQVTMKDICQETGLSRGGLYRHYGSTRQIFAEILDALMAAQDRELSEKMERGESARGILREVLNRYRDEMADGAGSLSMAILEFYSDPPSDRDGNGLYRQYLDAKALWDAFISYGIRRGEFKEVDRGELIDILLFAYEGVRMLSPILPVDPQTPERIIRHVERALLKGEA